jgi:hypothetical protein
VFNETFALPYAGFSQTACRTMFGSCNDGGPYGSTDSSYYDSSQQRYFLGSSEEVFSHLKARLRPLLARSMPAKTAGHASQRSSLAHRSAQRSA